jgi:hypothetical protein
LKEIYTQFLREGLPLTIEAHDTLSESFKYNQWMKLKCYRVGKGMEPSLEQHGLLFACFKLVLENNDKPHMQTKEGVKEACKVGIDFRDPGFVMVRPDGGVQLRYRSFSFKELPAGRERDEVMEKAFNWCADELGLEVDEMVAEAKSKMISQGGIICK